MPRLSRAIEIDSSPDPLAQSVNSTCMISPTRRTMRELRSPSRTPLRERDINSQAQPLSPPTYDILPSNSPMKANIEQTLSPWKIKVTVEAEPENGSGQGHTTTQTYQIPLKTCSSPAEAAAARGRGKKVAQSSPARKKRSGTPVRGGGSRRKSVTDLNITVLGDDEDEDEWSPKKKVTAKRKSLRSTPVRESGSPSQDIQEEVLEEDSDMYGDAGTQEARSESSEDLREIDLNRVSVRPRSASTRQKEKPSDPDTTSADVDDAELQSTKRNRVSPSTYAPHYPTPSPTPSVIAGDYDDGIMPNGDDQQGLDTVLESEGFTMIDLESVPSVRRLRGTPSAPDPTPEGARTIERSKSQGNSAASSSRKIPSVAEPQPQSNRALTPSRDDSDISSTLESSPPDNKYAYLRLPQGAGVSRKVTPDVYSSPKLPPPPTTHQKQSSPGEHIVPPRRVVKAGRALRGALSSPISESNQQQHNTPSSNEDDFLEGFSSGTKRELRAGLRFGEELAKRQSLPATSSAVKSQHSSKISSDHPNATNATSPTKANSAENGSTPVPQTTRRSPLSQQSIESEQPRRDVPSTATPEVQRIEPARTEYPTLERRQAELQHEWQLEREAVSRQIDEASPSKVIVIDDSSFEESEVIERPQTGRGKESVERGAVSGTYGTEIPLEACHQGAEAEEGRGMGQQVQPEARYVQEQAASGDLGRGASRYVDDRGSPAFDEGPKTLDEDSLEDETDIWLVEARDSSSPSPEESRNKPPQNDERLPPRRAAIPSPWKRGENMEESTIMTNGDGSGLFWQQPVPNKFGATGLARQTQRVSSGQLDINRIRSSPSKAAVSGRNNLKLRDPDESSSIVEESASEGSKESAATEEDTTSNESSLRSSPPQVVKIPIKFNDSLSSSEHARSSSTGSMREELRRVSKESVPRPIEIPAPFDVDDLSVRKGPSPTPFDETARFRNKQPIQVRISPASTISAGSSQNRACPITSSYTTADHVRSHLCPPDTGAPRRGSSSSVNSTDAPGSIFSNTLSASDKSTASSVSTSRAGPNRFPELEVAVRATLQSDDDEDTIIVEQRSRHAVQQAPKISPPLSTSSDTIPSPSRSALKGGRVSAGIEEPGMSPRKQVILDERSRYLNENGEESTMSANLDSPPPAPVIQVEKAVEVKETPKPDSRSWKSWLWSGKADSSSSEASVEDSLSARSTESQTSEPSPVEESAWTQTKTSVPTRTITQQPMQRQQHLATSSNPPSHGSSSTTNTSSQPKAKSVHIRPPPAPRYLLAPSFPSVPSADHHPLATSGPFTNAHFRTLHILHAKSLRSDFHAPLYIRPEIDRLLGFKVTVDETAAGLDEYEWQVGVNECEVLERFAREVEWGWVCSWLGGSPSSCGASGTTSVDAVVKALQKRAIDQASGSVSGGVKTLARMSTTENKSEIKEFWQGLEAQGKDVWTREMGKVGWGWRMEEVARMLGMVVIGEVVRGDEKEMLDRSNKEEQELGEKGNVAF